MRQCGKGQAYRGKKHLVDGGPVLLRLKLRHRADRRAAATDQDDVQRTEVGRNPVDEPVCRGRVGDVNA